MATLALCIAVVALVVSIINSVYVYKIHHHLIRLCAWTSEVTGLLQKVDWPKFLGQFGGGLGGVPQNDPRYP